MFLQGMQNFHGIIPEHGVWAQYNSDSALSDGVLRSPRKWASFGFWALASYPPGSSFLSQVLCRVSSGDRSNPGVLLQKSEVRAGK